MIVQIIIALGFVPVIHNLFKNKPEPLLSWLFFILGWIVTSIDMFLGYTNILEFVYPVMSLLGSVIILVGSWILLRKRTLWYLIIMECILLGLSNSFFKKSPLVGGHIFAYQTFWYLERKVFTSQCLYRRVIKLYRLAWIFIEINYISSHI